MLQSLRDHSGKWFAKVLFAVIALSFVVWGIADIVRGYFSSRPVAKVGSFSISYEEMAHTLHQEANHLQQISKGKIDAAQLKEMKLAALVYEKLVNEKAILQLLQNMRLTASDHTVKDYIQSMPGFKKDGQFDAQAFRQALQSNGISEAQFLNQVRKDLMTHQLVSTLHQSFSLPKEYLELLKKTFFEKRELLALNIPFTSVKLSKAATTEDLKNYYEENKESYKVPEFREAKAIILSEKDLGKLIPLSDQEVKDFIQSNPEFFIEPEKRQIRVLIYKGKEAAFKALQLSKQGKSLSAIALLVPGGNLKDLGVIEKNKLPEPLQKLEVGKTSDIFEDGVAFQIYEVLKIIPSTPLNEAQTKEKAQNELRAQKYSDFFHTVRNNIEDSLASGKSFEELAKDYQLQVISLKPLDKNGLDHNGKYTLEAIPAEIQKEIIDQAYNLSEGQDSGVVDSTPSYAFVLKVEKITPSTIPFFENIQSKVNEDWVKNQKQNLAYKLAATIAEQASSKEQLEKLAKDNALTSPKLYKLSQVKLLDKAFINSEEGQFFASLAPELLEKAFSLSLNKATSGLNKHGMTVLFLKGIDKKIENGEEADKLYLKLEKIAKQDLDTLITIFAKESVQIVKNEDVYQLIAHEKDS